MVIRNASPSPKSEPVPKPDQTMIATPASETAAATSVCGRTLSPTSAKASSAVTKGAVA